MTALRFFFRSWYGNVLILMLLAATSSFLITFYTTALSVPWSITLEKHLMIFLFSFVLMLVAILPISYVIYRLDANSYLRQHELLRYIIQFILLVLLIGAVALRVVYAVYFTFFRVDLQKSEYFERDYVVVMFCLIMVQVYYFDGVIYRFAEIETTFLHFKLVTSYLRYSIEIINKPNKSIFILPTTITYSKACYCDQLF